MKNALIIFKKQNESMQSLNIDKIVDYLLDGNIEIDSISVLRDNDDICFRNTLLEYKDIFDNVIVLSNIDLSFDIRYIISDIMQSELVENDTAKILIERASKKLNINFYDGLSLMPIDSTIIPNENGAMQGFMIEQTDFSLFLMPQNIGEFIDCSERVLLPYFASKFGFSIENFVFKYFGDIIPLKSALNKAKDIVYDIKYKIITKNLDSKVTIYFSAGTDKKAIDEVVKCLVGNLRDNIYAEFDTTLTERLFDVLKIHNIKIATAESFTGGRVASEIVKNSGVSKYFYEGIVSYSEVAKHRRLGVKDENLKIYGAVSSQVAYDMCNGLLSTPEVDCAIATTGVAGPNNDEFNHPVGLCFIGIGTRNGIHIYKYNFTGCREEITETAKNTALFLAIKNFKNI